MTRTIGPVTAAAAAGGTAGSALALVLVWVLSLAGIAVPEPVADAFSLLLGLLLALLGGWLVPPARKGDHAA